MKIGDKVKVKKEVAFYYEDGVKTLQEVPWFLPTTMYVIGYYAQYEGEKKCHVHNGRHYNFKRSKEHYLYECRPDIKSSDIFLAREEDLELIKGDTC